MGNEHVIPEITNKILKLKKGKLNIQGSGNETRSFIYIDDFVNSFKILLKRGKHKNIYNIGNKEEVTINNIVELISNILNKKIIIKGQLKKGYSQKMPKYRKNKENRL